MWSRRRLGLESAIAVRMGGVARRWCGWRKPRETGRDPGGGTHPPTIRLTKHTPSISHLVSDFSRRTPRSRQLALGVPIEKSRRVEAAASHRASARWSRRDRQMTRIRFGSKKHRADVHQSVAMCFSSRSGDDLVPDYTRRGTFVRPEARRVLCQSCHINNRNSLDGILSEPGLTESVNEPSTMDHAHC